MVLGAFIKREIDEDYYRFDVFGESTVTINLTNIPTDCDYDMKLFMYDNIRYADEEDISQIAVSVRSGINPENITITLQPGTYYI